MSYREFLMVRIREALSITPVPIPEPPPPPPPPPSPIATGRWVDVSRDGSTIAVGRSTTTFTGGTIYMCRGPEFETVTALTSTFYSTTAGEYGSVVATNADGSIVVCGANRSSTFADGYAAVRYGTDWADETIVEPAGSSVFLCSGVGGKSVAISDDGSIIVVTDGTSIYICSGTDWTDVITLTPSLGVWCVAISGDGTVVAAGNSYDRVNVYSGVDYATHTIVTPSVLLPTGLGEFGWSVALNSDGSLLVVGNPSDGPGGGDQRGAGFLFSGTDWATEQKFVAGTPYNSPEFFGWASDISADGSIIAFTAYGRPPTGVAFRFSGSGYSTVAQELRPDGGGLGEFGLDLSLSEDGSVMAVTEASAWVFTY